MRVIFILFPLDCVFFTLTATSFVNQGMKYQFKSLASNIRPVLSMSGGNPSAQKFKIYKPLKCSRETWSVILFIFYFLKSHVSLVFTDWGKQKKGYLYVLVAFILNWKKHPFSCHILIILCKSTGKISVCHPITSSIFLLHWMGFDILLIESTIKSLSDDWKIFEWDMKNVTWKIKSIFPLGGNVLTSLEDF